MLSITKRAIVSGAKIPELLVIGVGERLAAIKHSLRNPEMPESDVDALLDVVIGTLRDETKDPTLCNMLLTQRIIDCEVFGDPVGGDAHDIYDDVIGVTTVIEQSVALGAEIQKQLSENSLFIQGKLSYEYSRLLDDSTIVLRARRR